MVSLFYFTLFILIEVESEKCDEEKNLRPFLGEIGKMCQKTFDFLMLSFTYF